MKKILIVGSNFGSKVYLTALMKYDKKFQIFICSPNIYKKKINKKIFKYSSYKTALLENKIDFVICATTPNVQADVLAFIAKKKLILKGILLEKPISSNLAKTKKSINLLNKLNIPFFVNFIFSELETYKKLKNILLKRELFDVEYIWKFKQAYFLNKIPTWKIDEKFGGGLLNYYGIHVAYHLIDLFNLNENVKFKIKDLNLFKKKIVFIKIIFFLKKTKVNLTININSDTNLHSIKLINKKNTIKLVNSFKDWSKGFKLLNKKKIYKFKKESRIELTKKIIDKLILNNTKKNKIRSKYIKKVLIAHILCEKIFKKSKILIQ